MHKSVLISKVVDAHGQKFGSVATAVAYAPGRVEVLGNHTDYNGGRVLSFAVELGVVFCLSASDRAGVRLFSLDFDESVSFSSLRKGDGPRWSEFIKGVLFHLGKHGVELGGVDCTFSGSVPLGGGLSSSAALTVSCAMVAMEHCGVELEPLSVARICRDAERDFTGSNCGLLDQISSIFGMENRLLHIDFESLDVGHVDLPVGVGFLVVDTKTKHILGDSPYNQRRRNCESATERLTILLGRPVASLRHVSPQEFEDCKTDLSKDEALCASHVVGEIERVSRGYEYLDCGDVRSFGELLFDSHRSSKDLFGNSCNELDVVVDAAREAGALGARLTGGGWGGNGLVLVENQRVEAIWQGIEDACKKSGFTPVISLVSPAGGAGIVKP